MFDTHSLGLFFWDPSPIFFRLPLVDHPVTWYGVIFTLGLWLSYSLLKRRAKDFGIERRSLEQLTTWAVVGLIVGARLFHVLFYDWPLYQAHPLDILKVWQGGLASHGGVAGALFALFLFARRHKMPTMALFDLIAPLGALLGLFIRLGNFINQEILGSPSALPFAVCFGHPIDGSLPIARHPVQLYESALYGLIFLLAWQLWKKARNQPGFVTGLVLSLAFSGRIFLENFKEPMSQVFEGELLHMGAWLSLPILLLGLALMIPRKRRVE